jgi:hypothetical protein
MYFSRVALFIHVFAFYLFTSRSKASHLAMTHHTPFFTYNLTPPKKSRQLHEVKESPSNNDDNIFCWGKFWNFLHGIIYFLLTHFPIITIFPDLMSLGNYIPAKIGNMSTILTTFELEMKCARFLQSTSRLSTFSVGPFTTQFRSYCIYCITGKLIDIPLSN